MRPSAPVRWSWPAARRTRIQALSRRRSIASAPNSSANSAMNDDEDAEADAAREVVDLRADPQAGERDRPPAEQAQQRHRREQQAGERAVDALAQLAAALGQRAEADRRRARAGARRTARRCRMDRCASLPMFAASARVARQLAYSASNRSAYFSLTTLRLTFSVGVSSPVGCERSWSRIANFLTCSTWAYLALTRSISLLDQLVHRGLARRARGCPRAARARARRSGSLPRRA